MATMSWTRLTTAAALGALMFASPVPAWQKKTPPPAKVAPTPAKLDINWATQMELEKLPGITRLLAKKIISNRPYRAVDDLARIGVPKETIEKLRPQVTAEEMAPSHRSRGSMHPASAKKGKAKSSPPPAKPLQ
jgi:DNA uptake protein ComE-like DNA-binding protein